MALFQYPELLILERDLSKASKDIKNKAFDVTDAAIGDVVSTSQSLVPRDTGETADSISGETKAEAGYVTGEAGPTTRHAIFVEFGTYKDAPQAFMGPALDRHSGEWEERLADEAADIL